MLSGTFGACHQRTRSTRHARREVGGLEPNWRTGASPGRHRRAGARDSSRRAMNRETRLQATMLDLQRAVTVAELRAELLLNPDDAPVVVTMPDRAKTSIEAVHRVVSAGAGPGLVPDEVVGSVFSPRAWRLAKSTDSRRATGQSLTRSLVHRSPRSPAGRTLRRCEPADCWSLRPGTPLTCFESHSGHRPHLVIRAGVSHTCRKRVQRGASTCHPAPVRCHRPACRYL